MAEDMYEIVKDEVEKIKVMRVDLTLDTCGD